MKNVLFFTHHLWAGGAEKTVCALSEYINTHFSDIKSYICVVYDDPIVHKSLHNVIIMHNKSKMDDDKLTKAVNVLKQIEEMRRIKKEYHIETCISFLPGADIINVLSKTGEKQIVSVRNLESQFVHSIWKKIYVRTAYLKCDLITTVTEKVRQDVIHNFGISPEKVKTIYNSIGEMPDPAPVSECFLKFVKKWKTTYVNVAGLRKEKGQIHLLYAFRECLKTDNNCGLVIVGGGTLKQDLIDLTDMLGISEHVLFTDKVHNPYDYMKRCHIFVLSSDVEGMPNVLLEAMQCGLPVVATDCGAREILDPQHNIFQQANIETSIEKLPYGILVPVCGSNLDQLEAHVERDITLRENNLSSAMMQMKDNTDMRKQYIAKGQECLSYFAMPNIIQQWLQVI